MVKILKDKLHTLKMKKNIRMSHKQLFELQIVIYHKCTNCVQNETIFFFNEKYDFKLQYFHKLFRNIII
jgi:hypothetical protein